MIRFYVLIIFSIFLTGCKFEENVEFKKIDNVKVESIIDGIVSLSGEAEFYNPNDIAGKLKGVDIEVALNEKVLAEISQSQTLKIEKEAAFQVPFTARFKLEDVQDGLLSNLLNIIRGNKIKLHFRGEIKVSTWGFTQKVPVDYYEEVKLQ